MNTEPVADPLTSNGVRWLSKNGYPETPASPAIAAWMASYHRASRCDDGSIPFPTKGIMLAGSVGTGKTTALRLVARAFNVKIVSALWLAQQFAQRGHEWLWSFMRDCDGAPLAIDDIGSESGIISYGNKLPMAEIIMGRYDLWQSHKTLTHFTTNLAKDERASASYYGTRCSERIDEMCDVIPCAWPSFRTMVKL